MSELALAKTKIYWGKIEARDNFQILSSTDISNMIM